MNELVITLVILAVFVLGGLFFWNRMETDKKNGKSFLEGIKNSDDIYRKLRSNKTEQSTEATVGLVGGEEQHAAPEVKVEVEEPQVIEAQPVPQPAPEPVVEVAPVEPVVQAPVVEPVVEVKPAQASPEPVVVEVVKPQETVKPLHQGNLFTEGPDDTEKEAMVEGTSAVFTQEALPAEGVKKFTFDPLMETVVHLHLKRPMLGSFLYDRIMHFKMQPMPFPLRVYVRRTDTNRWYEVSNDGMFSEVVIVWQIANRLTVIDDLSVSKFTMGIQELSIAFEGDIESEMPQELLARARRLHNVVKGFDVQLSLLLNGATALSTEEVTEAARLTGFTKLTDHRYVFGPVKQINEATMYLTHDDYDQRNLSLVLDAPLAVPNQKPLHRLFSVANDLASRLDAELQDTGGTPINTSAAQMIFNQLARYYKEMKAEGIEPGSRQARILFTRDN